MHISLDVHVHFHILQVEALLQEKDIEGTLLVLEELVEATDHLETPTFPRDLDTAIDVVNQTLTQLVIDQDVNINDVSCHMQHYLRMHGKFSVCVIYYLCQCDGVFSLQTVIIFDVADNLLEDINKESFRLLQLQEDSGGSEHVLKTVERYALYVAHSIPEMKDSEIFNRRNVTGENLGMYLQWIARVCMDPELLDEKSMCHNHINFNYTYKISGVIYR